MCWVSRVRRVSVTTAIWVLRVVSVRCVGKGPQDTQEECKRCIPVVNNCSARRT
jgi:hypothetical protein